jgi:DNA mismatch repair protein MutH
MERSDAIAKLSALIGQDLRSIADSNNVTVLLNGKQNKGWAGHAIERYLGLPLNSSRAPNFGSWELKVIPVKIRRDMAYVPKETMAITMFDPVEVAQKEFVDSHLYNKLRKLLVVARIAIKNDHSTSTLYSVSEFDLDNPELFEALKADYDLIRAKLVTDGFTALTGKDGKYIQARTKGAGHGSTSRAFYARKNLVAYLIGLNPSLLKVTE